MTIARITGTNSGLDVDSLVKAAMKPYQIKVDKEVQNQKILQYQQEQYKKIMSDSSDFYDKYLDVLKTGSLVRTDSYNTVSFESGDKAKVTAKGFAGASVDNYTVSVTQLASKATTTFSKDKLKDKVDSATGTTKGLLYVNMGATTGAADAYVELAVTAKKEPDGTYKDASDTQIYQQSNGKFLRKDNLGNLIDVDNKKVIAKSDGTLKYDDGTVVPDKKYVQPVYELDMQTTADNLNKQLAQKNINITAKYSEYSDGIVLESGQMGLNIKFSAMCVDTTKKESELTFDEKTTIVTATNLDKNGYVNTGADLKGILTKVGSSTPDYPLSGHSNTVTVDNVQFSFKSPTVTSTTAELKDLTDTLGNPPKEGQTITSADGKTTTTKSSDGSITTTKVGTDGSITKTITQGGTKITTIDNPTSLTGETDVKDLKDKIVSFVNDYNKLLEGINTKIYEIRNKDYMPLTDEQKKSMSEDQIKAWETKAQIGLLRRDNDLERITSAMKSAMSSVMSGSGLCLERIGISPVKNYAEKNGMFTIDEGKLTKALEENGGNVKDLFTRAPSTTTSSKDKGGLFAQIATTIKSEFKKSDSILSKKAGLDGTSTQFDNDLSQSISKKKTLISELNKLLADKENALYGKYSNLETIMQNLNAQQSSLANMLGQK